jgi:hypothetical protein
MKLFTSFIVLILVIISFANCQEEQEREEVVEEQNIAVEQPQAFSTLQKICRQGYRLTPSGNCRKVLGGQPTTRAP